MALAEDVCFTCLSLGIQGIEGLLQPLFRGFAGIDGAADPSGHGFLTPKNNGPDHRVPVISRAILGQTGVGLASILITVTCGDDLVRFATPYP
jgi:hypothetical protein